MKHYPWLVCLFFYALCSCQKSNSDTPADLFEGKKLEGKWQWIKSTVQLKFSDGTVQNASVNGEAGDYLEFKFGKVAGHTSEGTFTSLGLGFTSTGKWTLAQNKAELDLIYDETPALYQFRRIDELTDKTLIMSADDKMVVLIYETNDVQPGGPGKTLVGGSVYDEYKKN